MSEPNVNGKPKSKKAASSFCAPRAALLALINASATRLQISAYLILCRFSDSTGTLTAASVCAVNEYTGCNKGNCAGALLALQEICAPLGEALVPIIRPVPVPATNSQSRNAIRYEIETFAEPIQDRVWFGAALVDGLTRDLQPLRDLAHLRDMDAKVLLWLYLKNDPAGWSAVSPISGPWVGYEDAFSYSNVSGERASVPEHLKLIRQKRVGIQSHELHFCSLVELSSSLKALSDYLFINEIVTVLDRNPLFLTTERGHKVQVVPDDAQAWYVLHYYSQWGYKPLGEEGVGLLTAQTAHEFGLPVTLEKGRYRGVFAALGMADSEMMIAGLWRLRYRPVNELNLGTVATWRQILSLRDNGLHFVNRLRQSAGLEALPAPWKRHLAAKEQREFDEGTDA